MKKYYVLFVTIFIIIFSCFGNAEINNSYNNIVPDKYILYQNYPNPFNPTTTIKYALPSSGFVTIKVFNSLGNEVATLVNEEEEAGYYNVVFDGTNFSSGVYYVQFKSNKFLRVEKMILLK